MEETQLPAGNCTSPNQQLRVFCSLLVNRDFSGLRTFKKNDITRKR